MIPTSSNPLLIGTNQYRWVQAYHERKEDLYDHLDEALGEAADAGIAVWEPCVETPEQQRRLQKALAATGLIVKNAYLGGAFVGEDWREKITLFLERARLARDLGAERIVTNPDPKGGYGNPQVKNDADLRRQAEALILLTEELRRMGLALDYHVHFPEFAHGAREFHHMLRATAAVGMGLNLDAQWVHRGMGNSQVGLEDMLHLYGSRIGSLHIRQSQQGIWTETLQDGDIDYAPVVSCLQAQRFSGVLTIELARENGTPQTLSLTEAHRRSVSWLEKTFRVPLKQLPD